MGSWEQLDRSLFKFINRDLSNPVFDAVFPVITDLQKISWVAYGLFPLIIVFFVWKGRRKAFQTVLLAALAVACADMTTSHIAKAFFQRLRPPAAGVDAIVRTTHYAGYSFPSNHAANNFAAAVVVASFYPAAAAWAWAVAALVAFSRVYVGVHFPADVVGGALWGALVGFLIASLGRRWMRWSRKAT